jgi:effector-binding domain-containing protein
MKAVKYIFILLLIVALGGSVYLSLQDSSYEYEKTITINAPKELVYNELSNLNSFVKWNDTSTLWNHRESDKKSDSTDYFSFSNDAGNGYIKMTSSTPTDQVRITLDFTAGSRETTTNISYNLSEVDGLTQLQMTAYGEHGMKNKFWNTLWGSELEETIVPSLQSRMLILESRIQEKMARYAIENQGIVNTSGGYYLYMTQSSTLTNVNPVRENLTRTIKNYMNTQNIDQAGSILIQYDAKDMTTNTALITVAIPVREQIITELESSVLCDYKEPEKTVKTILYGDRKHLNEAWDKGLEFIKNNGLERSQHPVYEIYKNSSASTVDPSQLVTEIYIPIN